MANYQEEGDLFGDDDNGFDMNTPIGNDSFFDDPVDVTMSDGQPSQQQEPEQHDSFLPDGAADEGMDGLDLFLDDTGYTSKDLKGLNLEADPNTLGEKADNAIDYGDLSDDDADLPDEEVGGPVQPSYQPLSGIEEAAMDNGTPGPYGDVDDLFGESSPVGDGGDLSMLSAYEDTQAALPTGTGAADTPVADLDDDDNRSLASDNQDDTDRPQLSENNLGTADEDAAAGRAYLMQMALFGSRKPETEEENNEAMVRDEYPGFDWNSEEVPYFGRLLGPRPLRYQEAKVPAKPPKPIRPNKVTLEIEPDQRLIFNTPGPPIVEPRRDIVHCVQPQIEDDEDDFFNDFNEDDDEPLPGGYTLQDLAEMCTPFDTLSHGSESDNEDVPVRIADLDNMDDQDDLDAYQPPTKKRKVERTAREIVTAPSFPLPASYDDFEKATAMIAARPILDLNDTNLLLEEVDPETITQKTKPGNNITGPQSTMWKLLLKFNHSNDADYDLLKQNHQHKIRGQLGTTAVEHSMPALRLQYPYFPVQRSIHDLRNWHRKKMHFKAPITFSKPSKYKRKTFKGRETKDIFNSTKDLSLGDNSTAALFEYSEEHPTMLSSTGMGNRVVNYYRRKTSDDATRPKHDVGELNILLPEDKSPFNQFGHVDGGEESTALVNSMYQAPIFEQKPQYEDFLVVRESTGLEGQRYYLRNIDNTYLVGQQLPLQPVPGIHSRNVTSASKNRLRAIAYRIIRHRKNHRLRVEDVTKHFPETTDMQNRQKMKEFMTFNKEAKEWEMAKGNPIPPESVIQSLLTPEHIALLEAKDVGAQYLRDAGYGEDDYDEDKDNQAGTESTEQLLAPWRATKNFVLANQGKAMLTLHGEGDPSGRGEAYSFLKTSMKGGFRAQGAPVADTVQAKKELGGHSYNVAKQQRDYDESIRKIWNKQKESLSSQVPPSDPSLEGDVDTQEDNLARQSVRATPASTPAPGRRINDDTASTISRNTQQSGKEWLKITRTKIVDGKEIKTVEVVEDQAVIRAYIRRKQQLAESNLEYAPFLLPKSQLIAFAVLATSVDRLATLSKTPVIRTCMFPCASFALD